MVIDYALFLFVIGGTQSYIDFVLSAYNAQALSECRQVYYRTPYGVLQFTFPHSESLCLFHTDPFFFFVKISTGTMLTQAHFTPFYIYTFNVPYSRALESIPDGT